MTNIETFITPQDFPEIRWLGHWIWVPEEPVIPSPGFAGFIDPQAKESHGLFRKIFTLGSVPHRAPARLTADSRYALYVNGQELNRGPIRSQFRRLHYDMVDLAPYLRAGENVIAIYVKYYGKEKSFWMPAAPNRTLGKTGILAFECNLGEAGWLVSDETWRAHRSPAWGDQLTDGRDYTAEGIPIEIFDARRFPFHWKDLGFDDSGWGGAQVVHAMLFGTYRSQPPTDPYGPVYPRSIGQLTGQAQKPAALQVETLASLEIDTASSPMDQVEREIEAPRTGQAQQVQLPFSFDIPARSGVWVKIDMGRIVSGFVQFSFQCAAGTVFDFSYTEEPIRTGSHFGRMRAGTRYIARGQDDCFGLFDTIGFRYAYLLAHSTPGRVVLQDFTVQEYQHPWQETASFECSDPRLEQIFKAGIRTVQLCSPDAFVDCPTREQRAWTGDGIVHQMVTLAANRDWRLAKRYVDLANSPRADGILPMFTVSMLEMLGGYTLPDWSMHWVHGVYNWYRYSADRAAVLSWLPTVARVLRWYAPYQTSAGVLKDVPEWNLVDWSSVSTTDTSSLLTAEWVRGLREFAEMAGWLGETASQAWAEELYQRAKAGFEIFWDEKRGSYIDHIVDGVPQPEMSLFAGALAITSGLAPEARWSRIIDTITDEKKLVIRSWAGGGQSEEAFEKQQRGIFEFDWDIENEIVISMPFMSYVVHDAVALSGKAGRLPDLYLRWLGFLQDGYDTLGENWGAGTHAHGWSCTPTRDILIYTLGVTPAEPGFGRARIAPRLGRLKWARGKVPTPYGSISVDVSDEVVTIESPIPFELAVEGQSDSTFAAGRHVLSLRTQPSK